MISEQGIIHEIKGNSALVRIQKSSACNHCNSKGSCNISNRDIIVEVNNELQAKPGDYVEVSIPEGSILKLSALVYFFPVIALLVGAFLGSFLSKHLQTDPTMTAIIGGGIFMASAFFILKNIERSRKSGGNDYPRITRILSNASSPQPCDSRSDRI